MFFAVSVSRKASAGRNGSSVCHPVRRELHLPGDADSPDRPETEFLTFVLQDLVYEEKLQ
jgi:hypothetical protein